MKNTIFFGNGINRLNKKNKSWDDLLKDLKNKNQFDNKDLPNTMIYERILYEKSKNQKCVISEEEEMIKSEISDKFKKTSKNDFYKKLIEIDADEFITTNYDYSFQESIMDVDRFNLIDFSTEDVYSIRRRKLLELQGGKSFNIWHIHGEINKHKTIMLGLDHYAGEIGKINSYIKGGYTYEERGTQIKLRKLKDQIISNNYENKSWIELFFNSNIYIFGFSLDYSEIDLWWILTKRKRLLHGIETKKFSTNKIYFYTHKITNSKKGLLESLDVNVRIIPKNDSDTWEDNYNLIISDIEAQIKISD